MPKTTRNLVLILGDQLDRNSSAFDGFDPKRDAVWMAEVREESTHVWSHKARIALFLSAMRHFRDELIERGWQVNYHELGVGFADLGEALTHSVRKTKPQTLVVVEPGDWRVRESLRAAAKNLGVSLDERVDRHFLSTNEEFRQHLEGRKQLRLEFFYRERRRRHNVLMDGDAPIGGQWNYDADNRGSFGRGGPGVIAEPIGFPSDETTKVVLKLVAAEFPDHPGELRHFDWPVTPSQARVALDDFVRNRLPSFGDFQDAMWTGRTYLHHSRLSAAMNLKLLDPRDVIAAAVDAYQSGAASLNSVEGFVRQILGWREYVRGIYWHFMPEYVERNALKADVPLPKFFWTGQTEMNCLKQVIEQTLEYGYAHHIQRLMATGLYSLLLGVDPRQVHEWFLAVYVDAVEWVELPNVVGMSQFADGGVMASKPYVASGKYIQRMSNYCQNCRFNPTESTGETACPFTTLYWDFLMRHEPLLRKNQRMTMQLKNLERIELSTRRVIRKQANRLKTLIGDG